MKTIGVLFLCTFSLSVCVQDSPALKLTKTIPLPGVNGRFDHFALDVTGHRLFVPALGNNTLEAVDVTAGKRLKSITDLHKPTGVLYLAEQNEIVVANGDEGTVKVFAGASCELVKTLGSLDDADNVRFDVKTKRVYVGYGDGALGVMGSATMKRTGSIKLAAHPESFQLEQSGRRIFVNVPGAKHIAVVDREKETVIVTWPMAQFKANFPMALDEANHRLFVRCRQPAWLVVLDTTTGQPMTDLAISGDADDLFYDAERQRLYISCGEGFTEVIDQHKANLYKLRERIPTSPGARTSFYSPEFNELYLAVPRNGKQTAEIRVYQVRK